MYRDKMIFSHISVILPKFVIHLFLIHMIVKIRDYNLKPANTFRIDATCSEWIEYTQARDLYDIFTENMRVPWMAIGGGSNILFVTSNYPGTILHSRILDVECTHTPEGVRVHAGAGVEMDALIEELCRDSIWGLENLSGIPGEVGASAVQNVGAYGVEAGDVIESVECFDTVEKRFVTLSNRECKYGYRDSVFKHKPFKGRYIVTYVNFLLNTTSGPTLKYGALAAHFGDRHEVGPMEVREYIIGVRDAKLPSVTKVGSAGSFFKNPVITADELAVFTARVREVLGADVDFPQYKAEGGVKLSAAWLIDRAGLKGWDNGQAGTWPTQPLVIVNSSGRATAADIIEVEDKIVKTVKEKFGVILTPEVEHIHQDKSHE